MGSADLLDTGDPFPELTASAAGGARIELPGDPEGRWAAVLLYRGRW